MNEPLQTPRRGRPRSEASRAAVLQSAFELLREKGYADISIDAVATRAGVGKATIYRWWSNKAELAVDAFFSATTEDLAFPDTGSASEDFRQQIRQLAALLRGPLGQAMASMIEGSRHDAVLRAALGNRWVGPRRRWGMQRLQRAIEQGECLPGLNPDAALEVMYSPVYVRMLFGLGVPDDAQVDAALLIVFQGVFKRAT
jgi:AcrR family transcriptional regulator